MHSFIPHYAYSSWINKMMAKTTDYLWDYGFVIKQYGAMQKSYSDVYQLIACIRFQNTLRVNSHIFLYHLLRVHMSFTFPNQVLPQTVQTTHLFFPQLTPSAGQENRI